MTYPEYRNRHHVAVRLRLSIFCGFVCLYFVWLRPSIPPTHPAILLLLSASFLTCVCYYNIIHGRWLFGSFLVEILTDVLSITLLVALLGGIQGELYLLYFCYCMIGGFFYNYRVAAVLAAMSLVSYLALFVGIAHGWMSWGEPFISWQQLLPYGAIALPLWAHPLLLALLLWCAVYAVKMGHNFSQLRERALEARNKELVGLQHIGGMIRTTAPLAVVAEHVAHGLVEGLDFMGCLLMLVDAQRQHLVCYPPHNRPEVSLAESLLGIDLHALSLPLHTPENSVLQQIQHRKIVFRKNLAELIAGLSPAIAPARLATLQTQLGIRKIVAIPLVAEDELLGALIGFSREAFVAEHAVATLEAFANQAALVLRVTLLIEQLKQANQELVEANRVKSEFLATMSHELRTPLTAIIGFSELLMEDTMGELTEEQRDSLREILNNGANLLELINNILDLAKAESGRLALHTADFDLRELLERTHRTVGSLLARKRHQFELLVPSNLPMLNADERRIQQIVLNLLGNAIKFTPEEGSITVEAHHFAHLEALHSLPWRPHVAEPRVFADGGMVLQVHDTGIGIPAQHLQNIFEMFRQVDSSVTRQYEGTGLGLALVKQLIEMHHGAIWATSEEGKWTTFNCLIPLSQPSEAALAPEYGEVLRQMPPAIRMPV